MNPLRVLQITHDLHIGGLQRVVVDLAKGLDKNRFLVSVCALRDGGPLEKELRDEGIEIIIIPQSHQGTDYLRFIKLYRILRERQPLIVHTHNTEPLIDGVLAALMARVPVRVHTDHARSFPDKKRYMFAEWLLSHFINQFVAVSEKTKSDLIRFEKISDGNIKVILNGVPGNHNKILVDKGNKKLTLGINNSRTPILGVVARLTYQKGISFLLDAIQLLVKEYPAILLLVAGQGDELEVLQAHAKKLRIEQHVMFLGARHDVPELLQLLDIFVLPSLYEGLPLVLLEAMDAGLPIVCTNVGGICEAVQEGINGLVVSSEDSGALAQAIRALVENPEMGKEFVRNSQRLFNEQFSVGQMLRKYEETYWQCYTSTRLAH